MNIFRRIRKYFIEKEIERKEREEREERKKYFAEILSGDRTEKSDAAFRKYNAIQMAFEKEVSYQLQDFCKKNGLSIVATTDQTGRCVFSIYSNCTMGRLRFDVDSADKDEVIIIGGAFNDDNLPGVWVLENNYYGGRKWVLGELRDKECFCYGDIYDKRPKEWGAGRYEQ